MLIVHKRDLPGPAPRFDGKNWDVSMSFFIAEPQPGGGPGLHQHEYGVARLLTLHASAEWLDE